MERQNIYVYIPREKLFNEKKRKYKQREKTSKIFYYVKNKKFTVDKKNDIVEIDIYNSKNIKQNCFYKDQYKSSRDKYFDHYLKLKPEYNNLSEIFIQKEIKNQKIKKSYLKNINKNKEKLRKFNENLQKKPLSWKEKRKLLNPFMVYFD